MRELWKGQKFIFKEGCFLWYDGKHAYFSKQIYYTVACHNVSLDCKVIGSLHPLNTDLAEVIMWSVWQKKTPWTHHYSQTNSFADMYGKNTPESK